MKDDMEQIACWYLKLSNHVTNQQLGGENLENDSYGNIVGLRMLEDEEETKSYRGYDRQYLGRL
jgi:hypothetical protein